MSTMRVDASEHPVRSVTIFKSWKAEIVRVFKLSLEAGENRIEIRRLSGSINTDSVRVAGLGDARLFDVVCALDTETDDDAPDSTPEAIRFLTAAQHRLAQRRDALTAVRSAMAKYSESLSGEHVSPEQADAFFEKYISRSESIADANLDIDEEMLRLSREIKQHAKKQASTKGLSNGKVTCVVVTPHATDVEVKLTYLVGNASWTPIYELHASTENGQHTSSVSLQYRARITQSTGEDWSGVTLSLSTADMMFHNQTIPGLVRTVVCPRSTGLFGQPMQQQQLPQPSTGSLLGGLSLSGGSAAGSGRSQPSTGALFSGGSLFGGSAAGSGLSQPFTGGPFSRLGASAAGSQPSTRGLFGGGGLFGAPAAGSSLSQPSTGGLSGGGGLFGGSAAGSGLSQPSSLFSGGGSAAGSGFSQPSTGSPFSGLGASAAGSQPSTGGLFGAPAAGSSLSQPSPGVLFGGGGLFDGSAAGTGLSQPSNLFSGGGLLGGSAAGSGFSQPSTGGPFSGLGASAASQPSIGDLSGDGSSSGGTQPHDGEREDSEGDWQVADADSQTAAPAPFAEPAAAIVKESPFAVAYAVKGEATIPSDGVAHQVSVANLTFKSTVVHVAVPKAQAVAYVQAKVKNTSDYRLLAGPVNVFVDDSFVSQISIQTDINPNDAFDCTLGADPAVRIRYTRTAAAQTAPARPFSEQTRTTTYTSRAVLRNTHAFAVGALVVRDALPVARGGVSTVLRRPEGLAGAKDDEEVALAAEGEGEGRMVRWGKAVDGKGGKKDGVFEWVCALGAGEEIVLETVWDVHATAAVHVQLVEQ
ncbi:hypothetical protein FA95DRAFT_1543906 [Auriscalpium vulgare]|uniref:Uncharacterized protein n=1 Tax=Auriscalpium vulgare TaxID=40419 RepID=A0ACB8RNH5_9AGAM|nr:hypothetical protein FA95DRAFT_1543906 [Auriscalpium vulgare]